MDCAYPLEEVKKEVHLYMCYEKRLDEIDKEMEKIATSILIERLKSSINVELRYNYLYITYTIILRKASKVDMVFRENVDMFIELDYCNASDGSVFSAIKLDDFTDNDLIHHFGGEPFPEYYELKDYPEIAVQKPDKNLVVYSEVNVAYPEELHRLINSDIKLKALKTEHRIIKTKLEAL